MDVNIYIKQKAQQIMEKGNQAKVGDGVNFYSQEEMDQDYDEQDDLVNEISHPPQLVSPRKQS